MLSEDLSLFIYQNQITAENYLAYSDALRTFFDSEESYLAFVREHILPFHETRLSVHMKPRQRFDAFPITHQCGQAAKLDFYSLKYVCRGSAVVVAGSISLPLEESDVFLIRPGVIHRDFQFQPDDFIIAIVLPVPQLYSLRAKLNPENDLLARFFSPSTQSGDSEDAPSFLRIPTGRDPLIFALVQDIYQYYMGTPAYLPSEEALQQSSIEQILLRLRLFINQGSNPANENTAANSTEAARFLSYIQMNLKEATLHGMASQFGYSDSYISRLLKHHTGLTFTSIVRTLKLEKSAELLIQSDYTIDEIMEQIGYEGRTNYYRAFRERFNQTPAEYRKSRKERPSP